MVCWGNNKHGQMELPRSTARNFARKRVRFCQVSAGGAQTFGMQTDGRMVCLGNNEHGKAHNPCRPIGQISVSYPRVVATGVGLVK